MLAETAKLVADLSLKGNFASQMTGAQKALKGFDAKLTDTQGRAYKAGQQIGTGIKNGLKIATVGIGLLASQVALGLNSLVKLEDITTQTDAVLKSTGGQAGLTAKEVRKLAEQYEALNATIGDEAIQNAENLLLTFTNIRKKAFEPALLAILNMNKAMGGNQDSLKSVVIQVGKALNDPTKGLTALTRVGVSFSAAQTKRIKSLQAEGKLYEAQAIVLAELNKEFGGSFLAGGSTTTGKVAKFTDSIEDLQRALATALLPTIGKVADKLTAFLASPQVIAGVSELGDKIAGLFSDQNIAAGAAALDSLFTLAVGAAPVIESAAKATGQVIGAAVAAFKSLPPEIQALAVTGLAVNKLTGGLVTNIAGGLISAVIASFRGMMNVNAAVVNVNGGIGGGVAGAAGAAGAGALGVGVLSVAAVAAVAAVAIDQSNIAGRQEDALRKQAEIFAQTAKTADLAKAIEGVEGELKTMQFDTLGSKQATIDVLNTLIREQNRRAQPDVVDARGDRTRKAVADAVDARGDRDRTLLKAAQNLQKAAEALRKFDAKSATRAIIAGIRARSAAKYGGTGLGMSAVDATFQRKLLHTAQVTQRANLSASEKLARLQRIQAELKAHGDTRTAGRLDRAIGKLKTELRNKDLEVTVNTNVVSKTTVNGRVFTATLDRTTTGVQGKHAGKKP